MIEVTEEDPCLSATVSVPAPQTNPPDHNYSDTTSFQASYTTSDSSCEIEYACVAPPAIAFMSFSTSTSATSICDIGSLDRETGVFQVTTTDPIAYPPGIYQIEIEGYIAGHPS